jgi:hypothetical protein
MASNPSIRRAQRPLSGRWLAVLAAVVIVGALVAFDGTSDGPSEASRAHAGAGRRLAAAAPAAPLLQVKAPRHLSHAWKVVARVRGQPAAWVAYRHAVALMRFEQGLVRVDLHAGSSDGGRSGWTYGDQVTPSEIHVLLAGFNGGFKLTYTNVGFMSNGHVAVPLKAGLASIVTYTDGTTNIGAWRAGVPSSRKAVFSVLQNQRLLVDRGLPAATVSNCVLKCWGGTIGLSAIAARSGLGITAGGQLIWAGGKRLTPTSLAESLIEAGAVRAIELDINPDWVAGYLYVHHPSGPVGAPVLPEQHGITGKLLKPYSRDFFAVVVN